MVGSIWPFLLKLSKPPVCLDLHAVQGGSEVIECALATLVVLVTWSAPLFLDNPPGAAAMRTRGRETWEEDTDLNSGKVRVIAYMQVQALILTKNRP